METDSCNLLRHLIIASGGFVGNVGAVCEKTEDAFDMLVGEVVLIANFDIHFRGVNEEVWLSRFGFFEHQDNRWQCLCRKKSLEVAG